MLQTTKQDMYVLQSDGTKVILRDCSRQVPVVPTASPTPVGTVFPTPVCTTATKSAIPAKRGKLSWMYWLKWVAIFIVVAALFYYMCANESRSRKKYFYSRY